MITRFLSMICCLLTFFQIAYGVDVSVQMHAFKGPEKPYIELSLYVIGTSMTPINVDSVNVQSKLEVLMTCRKGNDIVLADKYLLISPSSLIQENFMDVKRYALPNGKYIVTYELLDLADSLNAIILSEEINVAFGQSALELSDVQLLAAVDEQGQNENMMKNGVFMEPLPFAFYHQDLDQLIIYNEVYGLDQLEDDRYYATFSVATREKPGINVLETHKLLEPAPTIPLLKQIDIRDLPSGNYVVTVGVHRSDRAELVHQNVSFQRSNPERDVKAFGETAKSTLATSFTTDIPDDSLRYCLKAIAPVVSSIDNEVLNYVIKNGSNDSKRFFLHRYWTSQNLNQPEVVFNAYMQVAKAIDQLYNSGFGYGFETDRGHIYMKYGRPDDVITVLDEPSAPPYEIWFYNEFEATHQANVRFLFYNPSLADNDYELLHSTAIGERNSPRWEIILYGSAPTQAAGNDFISGTKMQDNFFRNARRYFEGN